MEITFLLKTYIGVISFHLDYLFIDPKFTQMPATMLYRTYYLMGTELQLYKMKRFLEMGGSDDYSIL